LYTIAFIIYKYLHTSMYSTSVNTLLELIIIIETYFYQLIFLWLLWIWVYL